MKKDSHELHILKMLLHTGRKLTATDFYYISNANQYFVNLENKGLIQSVWGYRGDARVKLRFIAKDGISKVKKYIKEKCNQPTKPSTPQLKVFNDEPIIA